MVKNFAQKMMAFNNKDDKEDDIDNSDHDEVALSGHIYCYFYRVLSLACL